eukprot:759552-Rhodomonas_salina.1
MPEVAPHLPLLPPNNSGKRGNKVRKTMQENDAGKWCREMENRGEIWGQSKKGLGSERRRQRERKCTGFAQGAGRRRGGVHGVRARRGGECTDFAGGHLAAALHHAPVVSVRALRRKHTPVSYTHLTLPTICSV